MRSNDLSEVPIVSGPYEPAAIRNIQKFRETFQKPSQIYKFLKENWKTRPLYLVRTLSFVNRRRECRSKPKRRLTVNEIAARMAKEAVRVKLETRSKHDSNGSRSSGSNNNVTTSTDSNLSSREHACRDLCFYNWICSDDERTSQKTKSHGFVCAWCERDFRCLDALMIHLKCSHQRLNFHLVKEEDGTSVIEMTINPSFDGSYCGFKYPGHDLRRDFRFTPSNPARKPSTTQIIYFKHKDRKRITAVPIKIKSGDGGDSETEEVDVDVCSGRLYYHTPTCLPVKPNEGDIDSEADMDPDWLRERTQLMIDEFTDVNEGEKEILKLWNLHIMKNYKYKGDNHMRQACLDFVEVEGQNILSKNLSKNFTIHLANLFDFGLISSSDLLECVRKLRKMRSVVTINPTRTTGKRTSTEHCQHSPPAKRALLNSHCNK